MSGASRARAKRLKELQAQAINDRQAMMTGGDVIDTGLGALRALSYLLGPVRHIEADGSDLAQLLGLIADEIQLGREVQRPVHPELA